MVSNLRLHVGFRVYRERKMTWKLGLYRDTSLASRKVVVENNGNSGSVVLGIWISEEAEGEEHQT